MAEITLTVPDDIAERLRGERDRLPEVLTLAVKLLPPRQKVPSPPPVTYPIFQELIDFLATRPTSEQIIAFRIAPKAQARLAYLLEKNREEELTVEESAELDWYEYVHEIMTRLKAFARPRPMN